MNRHRRFAPTSRTPASHRLCIVAAVALLAFAAPVSILVPAGPSLAQADPASPEAVTVYLVDRDATGGQTGETWAHAFTSLQDALDIAVGAEIWVAEGVYYPEECPGGTEGDRCPTFQLKQGVEIYGGFDGTENLREQRDWVENVTVLSGDLARNDTTNPDGVVTDPAYIVGTDNAHHVVTAEDVMISAKLNGFVITAGLADSDVEADDQRGAGINIRNAAPTLANLIIQGNKADGTLLASPDPEGYGGGMHVYSGGPQCSNVTLRNNFARTSGGGLYVTDSQGGIANLTFVGNIAGVSGGGMYVTTSDGHALTNLTFAGNSATEDGGGLYVESGIVLSSLGGASEFTANTAARGGGLYVNASGFSLNSVRLQNNEASEHGGGMYSRLSSYYLTGVTFEGNHAYTAGGGLYADRNAGTVTASVFSNNTSVRGAGMYVDDQDDGDAVLSMDSPVFVHNTASEDGGGLYVVDSPAGTVDGASFLYNQATGNGGGMLLSSSEGYALADTDFEANSAASGGGIYTDSSDAALTDVRFEENSSTQDGGGMLSSGAGSNLELVNVAFSGNDAGGSGGGLSTASQNMTMANAAFSGNYAGGNGGGLDTTSANIAIINATFSGNAAVGSGGGLRTTSPNISIDNTVIWNNQDVNGTDTASASISGSALVDYSLLQWIPASSNNLDGTDTNNDPQFVVPVDPSTAPTASGELSVRFGSPIVDVGNNAVVPPEVTEDLAGNARIYNAVVDRGAYELPLACPPPETTQLYVDQAASGDNTGVSGPNALEDLQDAFTLATNCEGIAEIWVAQGVYRPDEGVGIVSNDRTETYELLDGVEVYGGFDGPDFLPEERDWQSNTTVLSGDIDRNDITSGGIVLDPGNINGANSFHVVTGGGTGAAAVLDGFVITAGQANSTAIAQAHLGGGLYNDASSPTLANLSFVGNYAEDGGGLANVNGSSPSMTDVEFESNSAASDGGAILNTDSSPTLTGAHFRSNEAGSLGGALYNGSAGPALTHVSFRGNTAGLSGGAIYNQGSDPSLTNALLSGNTASTGAAIYNTGSSPTLVNITVSGNRATSTGGGMFNTNTNTIQPTVRNCIFWNNQDSTGVGTASATIKNEDPASVPVITYSLVQNLGSINHTGADNLDRNPWFTAPASPSVAPSTAGDYTLGVFSPAIDIGNNAVNSTVTDLAGDPRIINSIIDLGAYEAPYRPVYRIYLPTVMRNYK